jgi:hypothetical protein
LTFFSRIGCGASSTRMLKGKLRRLHAAESRRLAVRGPAAGMRLTFRAEVMPGRESIERTFEVARVLANGRVELRNLLGQHAITEFEPLAT